jgi:enoyl-CoA hydratase
MKYKNLIYERDGYIARIIFNRPDKMNAISLETTYELDKAITAAEEDDDVKVIIFKGAGRCFCAGFDLAEAGFIYGMKEPKSGEKSSGRPSQRIRLRLDRFTQGELYRHVMLCPKVTIVQAHGYCIGGGLMIAEKCDLILASEDCKFGFSEERLGTGGITMSPMLVFRVGLTKALELQITGKLLDGKEAERIHLINRAIPADQLETEAEELAQAISLYSRDGLAIAKLSRHSVYDMLGITQWFTTSYWTHTLFTNMKWEPDEYNFFKERRDKGVKTAAHEKQDFYKALDK